LEASQGKYTPQVHLMQVHIQQRVQHVERRGQQLPASYNPFHLQTHKWYSLVHK